MPFRSRAQQRFMFAQHPGIAHRWADEMKGGRRAPRAQREHPIKAANLPNRVRKTWVNPAIGTASSRRALRAAATAAEESAFRHAKPRPASTLRKPKTCNLGSVGKAIDPELPITPSYAGRANYRSGTAAVGKRMTGAVEGTGKPKRVQPPRNPARQTPGAGITPPQVEPNADRSKPPIHPSLIGKGLRASNAKAILVGRGYRNPRFARNAATHERLHAASLADPRMSSAQPADRMLAHENHDRLHKPYGSRSTDDLPYTIGKRARRYDPEDRRQRRLGAAGATLAGGGAGLTAWGGHGAYQSTRDLRAAGAHLKHLNEPGAEIRFQAKHQATDKAKGQIKGRVAYNRVADAKETRAIAALSATKNRPLVVGATHARRIGGGLGLIGAGAAVAHHGRSRGNRRYN